MCIGKEKIVPFVVPANRRVADALVEDLLQCPVVGVSDVDGVVGTGIYAIYYAGGHQAYKSLAEWNGDGVFAWPIHVGAANGSGAGGRRGLVGPALRERLLAHRSDLESASNLDVDDFYCRCLPLDGALVNLGKSLLVARLAPLWNLIIDGFEDCGIRRGGKTIVKSRWDTLHPGRRCAEDLMTRQESVSQIRLEVQQYLGADPPATVMSIMEEHT